VKHSQTVSMLFEARLHTDKPHNTDSLETLIGDNIDERIATSGKFSFPQHAIQLLQSVVRSTTV